jgi:hypothetical protein
LDFKPLFISHYSYADRAGLLCDNFLHVSRADPHIAFLGLIIDPACSLAFENEPAEADIMQCPPRDANARLFGGATLRLALFQGIGVLLVVMGAYRSDG